LVAERAGGAVAAGAAAAVVAAREAVAGGLARRGDGQLEGARDVKGVVPAIDHHEHCDAGGKREVQLGVGGRRLPVVGEARAGGVTTVRERVELSVEVGVDADGVDAVRGRGEGDDQVAGRPAGGAEHRAVAAVGVEVRAGRAGAGREGEGEGVDDDGVGAGGAGD
jgi:hypothetical protein